MLMGIPKIIAPFGSLKKEKTPCKNGGKNHIEGGLGMRFFPHPRTLY
jgi:hypothetical protein